MSHGTSRSRHQGEQTCFLRAPLPHLAVRSALLWTQSVPLQTASEMRIWCRQLAWEELSGSG